MTLTAKKFIDLLLVEYSDQVKDLQKQVAPNKTMKINVRENENQIVLLRSTKAAKLSDESRGSKYGIWLRPRVFQFIKVPDFQLIRSKFFHDQSTFLFFDTEVQM